MRQCGSESSTSPSEPESAIGGDREWLASALRSPGTCEFPQESWCRTSHRLFDRPRPSIRPDGLISVAREQRLERLAIDGLRDKAHRPVSQQEIYAPEMVTAKSAASQCGI